jgi:ABC-type uncharacterized transport system substrate-binding protein
LSLQFRTSLASCVIETSGVRITGAELLEDLSDQSKIYLISDLNIVDKVIALFHMVLQSIPQIIALIKASDSYSRYGGANALLRLSKRSKSLIF